MSVQQSRLRNFCFTLNNPGIDDFQDLQAWAITSTKYTIIGEEAGEEKKTPHLQGYCELKRQTRFTTLKSS